MFWFKRRKFEIPEIPGWNIDPPDKRDYITEEILGAPPTAKWEEKTEFRRFPIGDQNKSGSCVAWTIAKLFGVESFLESGYFRFNSARDIYSQRPNQGPGMYIRDGMKIGVNKGVTLEALMPSLRQSETQMSQRTDARIDCEQIALIYKMKNFLSVSSQFDSQAGVIEFTKKALAIGVKGSNQGWTVSDGFVRPPKLGEHVWHHALAAVDFGLINGKKYIVVDNSWGEDFGNRGQAYLGENYQAFMFPLARYFQNLPDDWRDQEPHTIEKPKHQFNRNLGYGLTDDWEVKILQRCFKWLGVFPRRIQATGNFYGITKEAAQTFQTTEGISPVYGFVGPKTRAALNKIFA